MKSKPGVLEVWAGNHLETLAAMLLRAGGYEGAHHICAGDTGRFRRGC